MVMPLYELTKKDINVQKTWDSNPEKYNKCIEDIKQALTQQPCLRLIDNTKKFKLVVDACQVGRGLGAILQQYHEDGWHPVSYWSKALSKTEREYSPTELECKGLHDAILKYSVYLRPVQFEVETDHNALVYMVKAQTQTNNGRLMRYLMDLQDFNFQLRYRKGEHHLDADAVSRLLQKGEIVTFLDADDLETDKGVMDEDEVRALEDLKARKDRLRMRIMQRKEERTMKKAEKEKNYNANKISKFIYFFFTL